MSDPKKKVNRTLKEFFKYASISVNPNIIVRTIEEDRKKFINENIPFTKDSIKEYIWGCKTSRNYHALLQINNLKYVYLYGNDSFDKDKFKVYISSNIEEVVSYMNDTIYNKYKSEVNGT